jgi:hypothetical protein
VTAVNVSGANSVNVGSTTDMTATAVRSDASTEVVTGTAAWQSSNPAVATVSPAGRVTAVAAGSSVISAAFGGRTGQLPVQVMAIDNVQIVTITANRVVINGTCDTDSIFESSVDGEFTFNFEIERSGTGLTSIWAADRRAFTVGAHPLPNLVATFTRNVTRGEDFIVLFTATEWDGLLGVDPKLNGVGRGIPYTYQNGRWEPDATSITVGSASCGATIQWSLESHQQ